MTKPRSKKTRALAAVEAIISESSAHARASERNWRRQEIAKLNPDASGMVSISAVIYISEKRGE